jgi:D-amino peptidase
MKRLFISADIEGIAGVAGLEQLLPKGIEWNVARGWMTAEVAAAASAALAHGYDEVIIADGHGNALNLLPDGLPANTRLVRSWPRPLGQLQGIDEPGVDACFMIGFHSGAQADRGVLAHTFNGGLFSDVRLNARSCSEAYLLAGVAGEVGIPTLLVTGDDSICAEVAAFAPQIETCAVKTALGFRSAASLPPAQAATLVGAAASRALQKSERPRPFTLAGPYELEVVFSNRESPMLLGLLPCFKLRGPFTVVFRSDSLRAVHHAITMMSFYPKGF